MKRKFTGERLETHIENSENTFEHLHRYALACSICKGKDVLDIACGEGYGSALLAKVANNVIGVDISKEVIEDASKKYKKSNLSYKHGSVTKIPLPNNSVDVLVSFETIEHLDQHEEMLSEIKRVLKTDGVLLMSSPDKKYYSDLTNFKNEFHVKELYSHEFKSLITQYFVNSIYFSQKMLSGSLIIHEKYSKGFELFKGDYQDVNKENNFNGLYNICIASDSTLPEVSSSFFYEDYKYLHELTIHSFKSSWRYRIGNLVLSPFTFIKKLS